MEISKNFDSKTLESKWYKFWMDNNFFASTPNKKPPFTIVIPPAKCYRYFTYGSHA